MGPKASVTYVKITGRAAYQLAKGEVSYTDMTATEIKLDAYPINQYLDDPFNFSDVAALHTQKTTLDSLGFTESQAIALAKSAVDSVGFSESVSLLVTVIRDFTDSFAVTDAPVFTFDKGISDQVALSEVIDRAFDTSKADSISLGDLYSSTYAKPASDAFSVSDSFSRVANFSRGFTEAFGLDEVVNVSPNWGVEKTNVLSFSDSFSYEIRAGHNAVLNTSALNTFTLNS